MSSNNGIASSPASKPAPAKAAPRQPRPAGTDLDGGANGEPKAPIRLTPELIRARSKSVPTVDPAVQEAWHEAASQLAAWALRNMVNNHKGCGGYWVDDSSVINRTTHKGPPNLPDFDRLVRHFRARSSNDLLGLHALVRGDDGVCWSRWTGIDIDKHDDARGDADANLKLAQVVHDRARAAGFTPLLSESDGKGGYHVLIIYSEPIEAKLARAFGRWLIRGREEHGVDREPEVFPKQDEIGVDGWGNWLRLPGHLHKRSHFSRVWDGSTWLEGRAAVDFILAVEGGPADLIPEEVPAMLAEEEAAGAAACGQVEHGVAATGKVWGSVAEGLGEVRPGDAFNDGRTWDEVLGPHGWTKVKVEGETTYWARPGVTDHHGATTNHGGSDLLYVFTDATGFERDRSYTKFGAFAVLEHGGDHGAAAKQLVSLGYGTGVQAAEEEPAPSGEHADPADPVPGATDDAGPAASPPAAGRQVHRKPPACCRRAKTATPGDGVAAMPAQAVPTIPPTPKPVGPTDGPVAMAPTGKPQSAPAGDEELGIVPLKGRKGTPTRWLWRHRIARGKLNLLAGAGGEGKSQLATRLIAMITNGEEFPDGSGTPPHGTCLILSAEDGLDDTIVPRLRAAGADLDHVQMVKAERTVVEDGKTHVGPMSFQDLAYWREVFERTGAVLMVVDPIPAYLGRGVDDHRNSEVRAVLEPFNALLDEFGVALLAITHVGKSADQKTPIWKVLGSVAYINLARTVSVIYRDPKVDDRRLVCLLKHNLSPPKEALAFHIEGHEVEGDDGEPIETSRVVFEAGTVDVDASELLAAQGRPRGPQSRRYIEMATWLYDRLKAAPGSVAVGEIVQDAGEAGFLGKLGKDGRWSNFRLLYRGAGRVPQLDAPRDGHQVVQYVIDHGGKKLRRLRLIPIGSVPPPQPGTTPAQVTVEIIGEGSNSMSCSPPG